MPPSTAASPQQAARGCASASRNPTGSTATGCRRSQSNPAGPAANDARCISESAAAILRPAIHATAAAARQRAISAALYLSAIQGAQRTALRAPRNIPRAKHRTSRNPETNVTDSGIQPRHEQSHPLREKSQTSASRTASAHLSAAVLALSAAVFLLATPAHAQSTNQLYMTGTGSGHAPTLYTNGVDSNISLAIHAEGNRRRRHRQHRARRATDLGLAGTTTGNLRLEGKTSGYVQISPSAPPAHGR